ncbi:MAG: hypothetical protein EOP07_00510 [Proteobacteria bacterium]|nr:MAG: hypothetical protein EOP07_00510 [Pseudomonadota bacterium]
MEDKGVEHYLASDAVTFLEKQHRQIEQLFANIESFNRQQTKQKFAIFLELDELTRQHSKLEEAVFYPSLGLEDELSRAEDFENHHLISKLLFTIRTGGENHQFFHTNIIILKEILHRHFIREEYECFLKVRNQCSVEKLVRVGYRLKSEAYKISSDPIH